MKRRVILSIWALGLSMISGYTYAGDSDVLPKGNFYFNVDYTHYIPWEKRYNEDGDVEDAATDFNTVLDSSIFPELAMFEGFVPGEPNVGKTVTSFDYSYKRLDATLAYGLTNNLSFGVKIPYIWYKNKVKANVDTTEANLGKNNLYQLGVLPPEFDALPLLPLDTPGLPEGAVTPITTEDVQDLIGDGLEINGVPAVPGYGYERFETWDEDGVGDIEVGLKYKYYQDGNWSLAALGGILLPTGEGPNEDNLQAQHLGGDCYALLFHSYNDYTGFENLTLSGSLYYTWTLPYDSNRRVVRSANEPLTDLKASVDTDLGDIFELKTSASYHFDNQSSMSGTSFKLLYHLTKIFKDKVTGPGPNSTYSGMEDQTDGLAHIFVTSVTYSTIPLFLKKEFPVPLDFSLAYRNRFAGDNNAFKTQYLKASVTLYF